MLGLKYLNPDEIRANKELVQQYMNDEEGSPIVRTGKALSLVTKYIPDLGAQILECGPGTGDLAVSMSYHGYRRLSGLDIDDYRNYRAQFAIDCFRKMDFSFEKMPFQDATFDAVLCFETIEHIENPYFLIREMRRVLKPGGTLILSMPNVQHIFNKIFFLRKGDMPRWRKNNGHLWVAPKGVFQKAFFPYFDLEHEEYFWGTMPYRQLYKIPIWPETRLFGHTAIFIFKAK